MILNDVLLDKSIKAKGKAEAIANAVIANQITVDDIIKTASKATSIDKGTCVESLEFATRINPGIANMKCWNFVIKCLGDEAPRVRWEAAKVIGNTAVLYPTKLNEAIKGLLINSEHTGTVVRWSAAHALTKISYLNTKHNSELIPVFESIVSRESDNAVRKIYQAALKKVQRK